jgi:translocator protein
MQNKNYLSLIIWIVVLIAIGGVIGSLTKPEITTWIAPYTILSNQIL